MRGRFDYALSSANDIDSISKFSLFICSEDFGKILYLENLKYYLLMKTKNIYIFHYKYNFF